MSTPTIPEKEIGTSGKAQAWLQEKWEAFKKLDINKNGTPDRDDFVKWLDSQKGNAKTTYDHIKTKFQDTWKGVYESLPSVSGGGSDNSWSLSNMGGKALNAVKDNWPGIAGALMAVMGAMALGAESPLMMLAFAAIAFFAVSYMSKSGMFKQDASPAVPIVPGGIDTLGESKGKGAGRDKAPEPQVMIDEKGVATAKGADTRYITVADGDNAYRLAVQIKPNASGEHSIILNGGIAQVTADKDVPGPSVEMPSKEIKIMAKGREVTDEEVKNAVQKFLAEDGEMQKPKENAAAALKGTKMLKASPAKGGDYKQARILISSQREEPGFSAVLVGSTSAGNSEHPEKITAQFDHIEIIEQSGKPLRSIPLGAEQIKQWKLEGQNIDGQMVFAQPNEKAFDEINFQGENRKKLMEDAKKILEEARNGDGLDSTNATFNLRVREESVQAALAAAGMMKEPGNGPLPKEVQGALAMLNQGRGPAA